MHAVDNRHRSICNCPIFFSVPDWRREFSPAFPLDVICNQRTRSLAWMLNGISHFDERRDTPWQLGEILRIDMIHTVFGLHVGQHRIVSLPTGVHSDASLKRTHAVTSKNEAA